MTEENIEINKRCFDEMIEYFQTQMHHCKVINETHYWVDMLGCAFISWSLFILALFVANFWAAMGILLIASIFVYRGISFVHELVHRAHQIKGFRIVWDVFFGIPFFYPSYFYHSHLEHHRTDFYGTALDPEYYILKKKLSKFIAVFWLGFTIPIKLLARALLFPLTLFSKKFANFFEINMSQVYINPEYKGHLLQDRVKKGLLKEDVACSFFIYSILMLMIIDLLPFYLLGYWYFVYAMVSVLNTIRFFVTTHGYHDFHQKTREEQVADSFTYISDSLFAIIVAPVGLRYHALHHLFPIIPYHALKESHLLLNKKFPNNLEYQSTFVKNALERLKAAL